MNAIAALLSAVCISVLTAVGLAYPCGGLNPLIAAAALGAGCITGVLQYGAARRGAQPAREARKHGAWEWFAIIVYTLFSLRAFCWLVFMKDNAIDFLSDNNRGDLPLHLAYINNLASGVRFWPENPIFEGAKLHYPLGVDIFNSLLKLVGVDVYLGLVCVGLAASSPASRSTNGAGALWSRDSSSMADWPVLNFSGISNSRITRLRSPGKASRWRCL